MKYKSEIIEKIDSNKEIVGIIGLGYVGLPLAVGFAEAGIHVIGFDKNAEKYGRQISSYASTCGTEYFAESFLMFMQGDELPDKDLEKLFKLLIK